jgi:hypothetical protein
MLKSGSKNPGTRKMITIKGKNRKEAKNMINASFLLISKLLLTHSINLKCKKHPNRNELNEHTEKNRIRMVGMRIKRRMITSRILRTKKPRNGKPVRWGIRN